MAKKLSDIRKFVDSSSEEFDRYLLRNIDSDTIKVLEQIRKEADVFVFSGVIRNFFLGISTIRDLDLVISHELNMEKYFHNYKIRKNSFGGYKIANDKLEIDVWFIEKSWAFQHQKVLNFELEKYIPSTAFFNFSSVVYNLNSHAFSYTTHFLRFIRDKKIDVVYKPNSNYELCIVNSFYYSDKYHLRLSDKLKEHILYLLGQRNNNFEPIQIKHFGKVLYSTEDIERKVTLLQEEVQSKFKIFIIHKKNLPRELFHDLKKDFSRLDVQLSIQVDNEEYHNFTGPELSDIILFLKESILSPAVYDAIKELLIKLFSRYKKNKKELGKKKFSIRYEDFQHRNIELNVEGYEVDEVQAIVNDTLNMLMTDEKEKYFSNKDFVDDFNSRIELTYNSKTKLWQVTNFEAARQWQKKWEETQEKFNG